MSISIQCRSIALNLPRNAYVMTEHFFANIASVLYASHALSCTAVFAAARTSLEAMWPPDLSFLHADRRGDPVECVVLAR